MNRVSATFEGEKLELEEFKNKDGKLKISIYLLSGHESIKMSVRGNELWKELKSIPDRQRIKVKADVTTFKDQIYLQATELVEK